MNRRSLALALSTVLAAGTFTALAAAQLTSIGGSEVKFLAVGPAGLKINGSGSGLSASEKDGNLVLTAPVTNLKTGIGMRDDHLKKYLRAGQHKQAKLVVDKSKLKLPGDNETSEASATGDLTLNGVTKPVKFTYKAKRTGTDYHVQGMVDVDIQKFEIEKPCYLGVCVDPNVKVKVKFKLRDK